MLNLAYAYAMSGRPRARAGRTGAFIIADNQLPIDYRQGYAQKDFGYDHPTVSTIPHPGPAAVQPINSA